MNAYTQLIRLIVNAMSQLHIYYLLCHSIFGLEMRRSRLKKRKATTNHRVRHMIPKSHPHNLSLIVFSEAKVFFNSFTVFLVLTLAPAKLSSILVRVSPYSATISFSVSYILLIFCKEEDTFSILFCL